MVHVARHDVTPEQVEEVCHGHYLALATYNSRILLVGNTRAGKILSVVLAAKGNGIYYPVIARPASRKERRYYRQQKEGEKTA